MSGLDRRTGNTRGFTILELMVGISVAMLVGIAAVSGANFFTAAQRQGMGTSSTVVGAATLLAALKEDVSQAGLGFFGPDIVLCNSLNVSVGLDVHSVPNPLAPDPTIVSFSPLQVWRDPAPASTSDRLDIWYGTAIEAGAVVRAGVNAAQAELVGFLPVALPVVTPQAVLLSRLPGNGLCQVQTVTGGAAYAAGPPTTYRTLQFGNGGLHNQVPFTTPFASVLPAPSGATAVTPNFNAHVSLLGEVVGRRYAVVGNQLVMTNLLDNKPGVPLLDGVLSFRVRYGVTSPTAGGAVTAWQDPTGAWAALNAGNVALVRAVQISVLTRSEQREKAVNAAGQCEASDSVPQLFNAPAIDLSGLPLDERRCFRYRVTTVTVPLRNAALGVPTP